jgi:hypothetical protein
MDAGELDDTTIINYRTSRGTKKECAHAQLGDNFEKYIQKSVRKWKGCCLHQAGKIL